MCESFVLWNQHEDPRLGTTDRSLSVIWLLSEPNDATNSFRKFNMRKVFLKRKRENFELNFHQILECTSDLRMFIEFVVETCRVNTLLLEAESDLISSIAVYWGVQNEKKPDSRWLRLELETKSIERNHSMRTQEDVEEYLASWFHKEKSIKFSRTERENIWKILKCIFIEVMKENLSSKWNKRKDKKIRSSEIEFIVEAQTFLVRCSINFKTIWINICFNIWISCSYFESIFKKWFSLELWMTFIFRKLFWDFFSKKPWKKNFRYFLRLSIIKKWSVFSRNFSKILEFFIPKSWLLPDPSTWIVKS